jgi:hypothetical protein
LIHACPTLGMLIEEGLQSLRQRRQEKEAKNG